MLLLKQYCLSFKSIVSPLLCLCVCSSVCAHLVIRDLLQVDMGSVDHLHAGVAVVCAAESAELPGVWIKPVSLLSTALQRIQQ